ncbi:CAP-associated domain-containing protein [Vagococcus humatus]|uniref:CAP-associated domain-containing protein n=1 Tax=Vagococcus humatus TaxID=1889241 RepID=A0A429Z4U2_9ENTE|nr:CAP-associated domain-containing protein [Vagococcus humatus]RST88699.1 hypothetical protein C7P63_08830 [Vagococcus humatus]
MKRLRDFLIVFALLLVVAYAQPVVSPSFFSPKINQEQNPADSKPKNKRPKKIDYEKIPTVGLASFIHQDPQELTKEYGEPLEIQTTSLGYDWWILGEDEKDYMQVAVRNHKVQSIFVLGKEVDTSPFRLGMSVSQVLEIGSVSPDFKIDNENTAVSFELSEKDMNHRPLLAFDNGSFAMLHFSQKTNRLIGIRYLDKETLLRLMPYQLNEEDLEAKKATDKIDWETVDNNNERQFLSIFNILKEKDQSAYYSLNKQLDEKAEQVLTSFLANPEQVLKNKNHLINWEHAKTRLDYSAPFYLTNEEFKRLLALGNLSSDSVHGIIYTPAYDVPMMIMNWYSEGVYRQQFSHKKERDMGIYFYEDVGLFLFGNHEGKVPTVNETEGSDSR